MVSWKYFPCLAGSKQPALEGDWRGHATDDEEKIQAWLDAGMNLAIDCEASGLTVIDLDGDDVGRGTWRALQEEYGLADDTYMVRTPRGGFHYYFTGEAPSSVQKLGPKLDTRGRGGYVLCPPSETGDGAYTLAVERGVAPLPGWIPATLASLSAGHTSASVENLDQPQNIQRGIDYLARLAPLEQGSGADAGTLAAALKLRDFGISPERSIEILMEHLDIAPQDDRFEAFITRKVENAWAYAQNDAGAWGVAPASELFTGALDKLPGDAESGGGYRYQLMTPADALRLPAPEWLFPGIMPKRCVMVPYGQQEMGKTFWVLDMALHLASGRAGYGRPEQEPQDVVFFSGEGFDDLVHNRITSWCASHGYPIAALKLHLLEDFPNMGDDADFAEFVQDVIGQGVAPAMVILDTYARVMARAGLDENKALDVMRFVSQAEILKQGWGCAVLAIHHSGKDDTRGPRGSGSLIAAVDVAWEVKAHWDVRAFDVRCEKMKGAPKPQDHLHYEGFVPQGSRSLVLRPLAADDFRQLTAPTSGISARIVGQVLGQMGAVGLGKAVTTAVLASELYTGPQDELAEDRQANLDRVVRQLRAAAKRHLEIFVVSTDAGLGWAVPG